MCKENEQRATGNLEEIGRRDHEVTSEYRIFGPPGTGKTTNLTRQIARAADRYGPESILVTSFSRAAAAELAGRDLPVSPDRVGTLHSHCWHALGGPEIAEANVDEWNKDNPSLAITPQKKRGSLDGEEAAEDGGDQENTGDEIIQRLARFRGMMQPREAWPAELIRFEQKWTAYKKENGLLDFTDLIETAWREVAIAPRNPSVIFADEAQDLNRMQLSLVRKWGRARRVLHRRRRRRSDHLFVHRRLAGSVPRSGHSGRPQDHPEAVVPRASRRPQVRGGADPAGSAAPGQGVPAAPGGRCARPDGPVRHLQPERVRNPEDRRASILSAARP